MAKNASTTRADASPEVIIHRPFKAGVPDLSQYLKQMWARREFMHEFSLASRRLEHQDTVLGQTWSVLSPLFMAGVYYTLVFVLRGEHQGPEYFIHLLSGVFVFNFIATSSRRGATSVTGASKLIMNTSFPRAALPITQTWTAFLQFLPSLLILILARQFFIGGFTWALFYIFPILLCLFIFASGLAMLTATANVYFRDTTSLLPYVNRLWMYASPVLYFPTMVTNMLEKDWLVHLNPLFDAISIWSGTISQGITFPATTWLIAFGWAVGLFVASGFLFLYREGEFAVRI